MNYCRAISDNKTLITTKAYFRFNTRTEGRPNSVLYIIYLATTYLPIYSELQETIHFTLILKSEHINMAAGKPL